MIRIEISAYNRHTAGPLRRLEFHISGLTCSTGNEDQFAHGSSHARSIILGLEAMEPTTDFSIRAIDVDAHGAGTAIDGVSLFDIQLAAEKARKAEGNQ